MTFEEAEEGGEMNLEQYGLHPQRVEVFDASMLSEFAKCPSKFYLRYILGLKPRMDLGNPNLVWGTLWHNLMYKWWDSFDREAALSAVEPWPEQLLNADDKKGRTHDRMIMCFDKYVEKYHTHDMKSMEVLRREQYFDIDCGEDDDCPLGGCGLRWCGRMDKLVKVGTHLGPVDYKTTGALGKHYWDRYKYGFQIPGYVWAAVHLTNSEVRSAWLDVLYVLKASEDLYRRELMYSNLYLQEWVKNTKRVIADATKLMDSSLDDPEAWRQNREECTVYSLCEFADVHFSPNFQGTSRYRILGQDYVEERWDPSAIGE